jgi:hypothetical protein
MPDYTLSSILPFVRLGLRQVKAGFTLTEFANVTWTELENSGAKVRRLRPRAQNNPDNPEFAHNDEPDHLRQSAVEAWLYLQRRGFAIPASRNFPGLDGLRLELTKRGREWIEGQEPTSVRLNMTLPSLLMCASFLDLVFRRSVSRLQRSLVQTSSPVINSCSGITSADSSGTWSRYASISSSMNFLCESPHTFGQRGANPSGHRNCFSGP